MRSCNEAFSSIESEMPEDRLCEPKCVTIPQFLQIILQKYWSEFGWVFRGQDNIDWPLRPKAGRDEFYLKATSAWVEKGQSSSDLGRFNHWREQAGAVTDALPQNDFSCLALSRPYRLS